MDEIADNKFTELHTAESFPDVPSLLTIILELTPNGWYNIKQDTSVIDVVKSLLVFLNGHLALNNSNQVSFILSTPTTSKVLFPNPEKEYNEVNGTGEESNTQDSNTSLVGKEMYRQFRIVDETILEELNKVMEEISKEPPQNKQSKLSGALSRALTYTNRMLKLDQSISTTTASAISSATNMTNKESSGQSTAASSSSAITSSNKARVLIVTANDNEDVQYISLMNSIFAAQKMKVPIDIAKMGKKDASYLQQAADATNGVYLHIERPSGFIQVLSTAYFIEPSLRPLIILPTNSHVNYRASCFLTGKSVEIGYVCSVCLCIISLIPESLHCPTCNSKFDEDLVARLKKKPAVKKRKLENGDTKSES